MRYTKPPLNFEEQAQQLIDRGLIVSDQELLTRCLSVVNYYRLSAYWYPFKLIDPITGMESFKPGTTFEEIWNRYTFDRRLRLLVMDAIEHIEVAIFRTIMVEQYTLKYGPFGYCEPSNFIPKFEHIRMMENIEIGVERSKEEFVQRFKTKYFDEPFMPLWITAEIVTFGQLFTFYRFMHRAEKQCLAKRFDLFPPVFESWLHSLLFIRNTCAHHARLWNRKIPIGPKLPDKRHKPDWYDPIGIDNRRVYAILVILNYLLSYISDGNDWSARLNKLLLEYDGIPIKIMGFPDNWSKGPLWDIQV